MKAWTIDVSKRLKRSFVESAVWYEGSGDGFCSESKKSMMLHKKMEKLSYKKKKKKKKKGIEEFVPSSPPVGQYLVAVCRARVGSLGTWAV
jgi:hypothetical protein